MAAIASNGDCFTWGAGRNGRLGHGHERDRWTALLVAGLRDKRVVDVSCGVYHTAVVTGTVVVMCITIRQWCCVYIW